MNARWLNPRWQVLVLLALTAFCAALNWLKLGAFWGDGPRAWFEIYRASLGEIPYRDFTWPYPPLTLALLSSILHIFGATFPVAQITVDLLSLGCVLGVWTLARRLAPPLPAFAATLAFTLVGATNGGSFALFSLLVYTPAILVGGLGLLLAAIGLVDYIRTGLTFRTVVLLVSGGLVCCLSRPECAAAILLGIACLALIALRSTSPGPRMAKLKSVAAVAALLLGPSLCVYGFLIAWIGYRPLAEGITGYGLASLACPWWPTGFGVLGAGAALCAALAVLGILALLVRISSGKPIPWSGAGFWAIPLAAGGWLAYSALFFRELSEQQAIRQGPMAVAYFLITTNTFLLPIMWLCIAMFVLEGLGYLGGKRAGHSQDEQMLFVLLGLVFALSTRNLFNTVLSNATTTTPMLYPMLFAVLPLLVREAFGRWSGAARSGISSSDLQRLYVAVSVILCLYGGIRLVGFGVKEARKQYVRLNTGAGPVKLSDNGVSAEVYEFMQKSIEPGETFADVGYGGGVNFALHRSTPLYTTQFTAFRPTAQHRERDYSQLNSARTRFVIGQDPPIARYGTEFGCAFPRFVWKANGCRQCDNVSFPVMQLILDRYRIQAKFGDIAVYVNKSDGMPTARSMH
jgi:hypothetical protein